MTAAEGSGGPPVRAPGTPRGSGSGRSGGTSLWRYLAAIAIVVAFFAYPWAATGTESFPADRGALDSVSPANSTSVVFDAAAHRIDLTSPSPGSVRVDLLHTYDRFQFTANVTVLRQTGVIGTQWSHVHAGAALPNGSAGFFLQFGTANATTVDLASVRVVDALDPTTILYDDNFSGPLGASGWNLSDGGSFGSFGQPPLKAIQVTSHLIGVADVKTSSETPIPAGVNAVDVQGTVRFNGSLGPFHIALDVRNGSGGHLAYLTDWGNWTGPSTTPYPLVVEIWDPGVPIEADLTFLPESATAGSLRTGFGSFGSVDPTARLVPYRTGEPIALQLTGDPGHRYAVEVTPAGGPSATWSIDASNRTIGLHGLLASPQITVSALVASPTNYSSLATISNATVLFQGAATYGSLGPPLVPTGIGAAGLVAILALLAPDWRPPLTRALRRLLGAARRGSASRLLGFLRKHATLLGFGLAVAGLYGAIAWAYGGHPYDSWSFKVWIYAVQAGGIHALYVQPAFVGDAFVRGGDVPWSTVGFAYGPLSAELFGLLGPVLPPLGGLGGVPALGNDVGLEAEIKWVLALFTIAAGGALYASVRRTTGRSELGLAAALLLVLNPAIAFDSAAWGETDSVLYLLFVLFAIVATWRPTWALVPVALAVSFKETGAILLLPTTILLLAPGLRLEERFRRLALGVATLLAVDLPVAASGVLPSSLFSPYAGYFGGVVVGGGGAHPVVSPDTYTVWTLFTGPPWTGGFGRMQFASAHPILGPVSFALLALTGFAIVWLVALLWGRRRADGAPLEFWLLTTALAAFAFTALLTGTASRYYTLALPGLAGAVVLIGRTRAPVGWRSITFAYLVPTAVAFYTMLGLFGVIVSGDVPGLRGFGGANPVVRFVEAGYANGGIVTLGSLAALLALFVLLRTLRSFPDRSGSPVRPSASVEPAGITPDGRAPGDVAGPTPTASTPPRPSSSAGAPEARSPIP